MTPICVDLDDTLIHTDALHEYFVAALKKSPLMLFCCLAWLLKGRSYLKSQLVKNVQLNVDQLPYNTELLTFLKEKSKLKPHPIYLVSASNTDIVQKVIRKFEFFDAGYGSTEQLNLKGKNKAEFLEKELGAGNFDYIGDCKADIPIWNIARDNYLVGSEKASSFSRIKFKKVFKRKKNKVSSMIKAIRVYQWAKNLLIFAPMILSHNYTQVEVWTKSIIAFISFSFMASSIYLLNDLFDMPSDREHYKKKYRPLASGELSIPFGIVLMLALIAGAFLLSTTLSFTFTSILLLYTLLNIAYSFKLKKNSNC